jgi:2-hydroxy-6-oxonona-2,4-dienedioate hydrolase
MSFWSSLGTVGHSVRYVQAGPIRTRILEAGTGEAAIVLLHGSGGHLEAYARNAGPLGEHFRVVVPDMIGHGYSARPDRDYAIADYCAHLLDLLDALGLERVHLAGESLGGWIGAAFAARFPERVRRLVINTPAGLTCNEPALERQRALFLKAVDEPSRENVRARLEWLMADPSRVTDDLVDARYAIYTQPGYARTMRHICSLMEPDGRRRNMLHDDDLRNIGVPVLVLWTAHNPTDGVEVGERAARAIPNARLEVMEGCGHWPQFEDPPRFNALLRGFLNA